jgi:threonine synthase
MRFYSTNKKSNTVSLKEAVLQGLADDGGLFMPVNIPEMPDYFFKNIGQMSFPEISYEVANKLFQKDIPADLLKEMIFESFDFPINLVEIEPLVHVLELFHGPTLAFKDFAARMMARMISYFARDMEREITILVATSGDTGSAVASGFFKIKGIRVVILYPSKKVSSIQESQLTTMGENITAIEVKGTFDDCQNLVKTAFVDPELNKALCMTSSNSINIARLFPQSFYYFYAYAQLVKYKLPVAISVPSGNFGNLTGGLLAKRMGLPVYKFIAANNINDSVARYLGIGRYDPKPSKQTISNAMDVGNPSNFVRMTDLYNSSVKKLKRDVAGFSFNDKQTKSAMLDVFKKFNYVLDPHGAVGYLGLKKYLGEEKQKINGVFFETAHPAKFKDVVEETIRTKLELPESLQLAMKKEKKAILMENSFLQLKEFLLAGKIDS